jgi:hypothetical protein
MSMRNLIAAFTVALATGGVAHAQDRVALKSGESVELSAVYWVINCRSVMIGIPEIEILEGLDAVSLAIKQGMVMARRQNCPKPVPGGTLVITAKDVSEPTEGKLTFRLKYKTKDGDRQISLVYRVSLFP